jgi:hypothetical protein
MRDQNHLDYLNFAIVGKGPTNTYALQSRLELGQPISTTAFKAGQLRCEERRQSLDRVSSIMLANTASIEIPSLSER